MSLEVLRKNEKSVNKDAQVCLLAQVGTIFWKLKLMKNIWN